MHTSFEHNDDIKSKLPYMKSARLILFAQGRLNVSIPENIRVYKIDAPETIQVLNEGVQ